MNKIIYNLCEDTRMLTLSTEAIGESIKQIDNHQLRNRILEMFRTCQADFLILTDFLYEIIQYESDEDLAFFLNSSQAEEMGDENG